MDKAKVEQIIKTAVYKGIPIVGGLVLAATLVPLDGGVTLVKTGGAITASSIAKFGFVGLIGYGAVKAALTPNQLATVERIANATAEAIRKNMATDTEHAFA